MNKKITAVFLAALFAAVVRVSATANLRDYGGAVIAYNQTDEPYDGSETVEIASRVTKFNEGSVNRASNIRLAVAAVDGYILCPGDEFSYNAVVGPTTKARGYKMARTFLRGKETKDYGGGVCQVSSTIHAAAVEAGLDITERHPHSRKVRYVEDGMDAATSYDGYDLKFVNTLDYPIVISASVNKGRLTARISVVK